MNNRIIIIANRIIAKKRPETIFDAMVFDVKEDIKNKMHDSMLAVIDKLKIIVKNDLSKYGYKIISIDSSMGNFRGHPYIGSFKILLEKSSVKNVENLVNYLHKYSLKFKFKGERDGNYEFNTR